MFLYTRKNFNKVISNYRVRSIARQDYPILKYSNPLLRWSGSLDFSLRQLNCTYILCTHHYWFQNADKNFSLSLNQSRVFFRRSSCFCRNIEEPESLIQHIKFCRTTQNLLNEKFKRNLHIKTIFKFHGCTSQNGSIHSFLFTGRPENRVSIIRSVCPEWDVTEFRGFDKVVLKIIISVKLWVKNFYFIPV